MMDDADDTDEVYDEEEEARMLQRGRELEEQIRQDRAKLAELERERALGEVEHRKELLRLKQEREAETPEVRRAWLMLLRDKLVEEFTKKNPNFRLEMAFKRQLSLRPTSAVQPIQTSPHAVSSEVGLLAAGDTSRQEASWAGPMEEEGNLGGPA